MLKHIFSFEVRYWLKSWTLWIFLLVIAVMIFGAASTDDITLGDSLSNTFRNSPYNIQNFYAFIGLITMIMAPAFMNSAAARDFSYNTYQIVFSTPLKRSDFLLGRFSGAALISLIPMLGVSIGMILAKYMPWVEPERWEGIVWKAHLNGIWLFALPNGFIIAAILFAVAVWARNEIASFVSSVVLLAGYIASDILLRNVERQKLGAILDPFGIRTYAYFTRYWTVAEKNTLTAGYSGYLLWNRLLWVSAAVIIFALAYWRFSFAERKKKVRAAKDEPEKRTVTVALPAVSFYDAPWKKYFASLRIHFLGVIKSPVFIVIVLAALLNCIPAIALNATENYGGTSFPVTLHILDIIAGTLYMFILTIITYYAGILVWKDRDTRMDEIIDSTPSPEWVSFASRLTTLIGVVVLIQIAVFASGVIVQAAQHFYRFQFGLYAKELLFRDLSLFVMLAILAFFFHALSPNKYVGYFVYVVFLIGNFFAWTPLNVASNLPKFANRPRVIYSDFFTDAPFRVAWSWFSAYWILCCALLYVLTVMFWPRGKVSGWHLGGHADWVNVETVISTSPDQIAVAPGSLVREWEQGGRRYFQYKLDHPALGFYSFISARYEVAREQWNGISLEVYYHKDHAWNVPRMMNSMKKSLAYFTQNFGPYYHKEARIIEFPRVATFAQAFPGTMPYSEAVGFIANLNHPDDIDMVFYVVAHEMGHQWWAHQVIGANMQGATLLSETVAQYSALMVMEHEYGRDMMRKFLRYEMDRYLSSRGKERQKERPLLTVEAQQGYVHYQKGSLAIYYLKEMIGEEAVNRALRRIVQQYAYAPAPYPTSYVLIDALREQTPPDLQYLIKDLFEDITIFSNRTLEATAHKRADGKYDVTIDIETRKFKANPKGNETEVPVNDWIEIGAFAKPEKEKKYGKTLYRERVHLTGAKSTHTFTVDSAPYEAGVDPFMLLIDRVPDDNVKQVSITKATTTATRYTTQFPN